MTDEPTNQPDPDDVHNALVTDLIAAGTFKMPDIQYAGVRSQVAQKAISAAYSMTVADCEDMITTYQVLLKEARKRNMPAEIVGVYQQGLAGARVWLKFRRELERIVRV